MSGSKTPLPPEPDWIELGRNMRPDVEYWESLWDVVEAASDPDLMDIIDDTAAYAAQKKFAAALAALRDEVERDA